MQAIPLIRKNRVTGFWGLLDAAGLPADRTLGRAVISRRSLEDPSGFLPGRQVWGLLELVEVIGWSTRAAPWAECLRDGGPVRVPSG